MAWTDPARPIPGLDLADGVLLDQLELAHRQNRQTTPLIYLFARMLPLWPAFAAAMRTLFRDFRDPTRVACLKGLQRAAGKSSPVTGDYLGLPKPHAQHVKDYLRCEQRCDGHAELLAAAALVKAAHEVVQTKDRRSGSTHDVVLLIRFQGVVAEIQLTFRAVNALKAFQHVAYGISRANTADCTVLGTLYNNSWLVAYDLEGADPAVAVVCTEKL